MDEKTPEKGSDPAAQQWLTAPPPEQESERDSAAAASKPIREGDFEVPAEASPQRPSEHPDSHTTAEWTLPQSNEAPTTPKAPEAARPRRSRRLLRPWRRHRTPSRLRPKPSLPQTADEPQQTPDRWLPPETQSGHEAEPGPTSHPPADWKAPVLEAAADPSATGGTPSRTFDTHEFNVPIAAQPTPHSAVPAEPEEFLPRQDEIVVRARRVAQDAVQWDRDFQAKARAVELKLAALETRLDESESRGAALADSFTSG